MPAKEWLEDETTPHNAGHFDGLNRFGWGGVG